MRTVASEAELPDALAAARREAESAFGDGRVYLEKLLVRPRHVEVQVLGDRHGTLLHLGERECSIQRRHQKIVEETPSPAVTPRLRAELVRAALAAARAVGYVNAGTVEFLLDRDGRFYFLEMNTRVQVEHPITEWVTGIDIVAAQLRVAAGAPLGFGQADVRARGHAIEARLYAEDPAAGFLPSAGPILALREPGGPGVRVDSGIAAGGVVPVEYDPLLGKISAWGEGRAMAIARLSAALRDTAVLGPTTNLAFLQDVLAHPAFRRAETHTGFLAEHFATWQPGGDEAVAALAAALALTRPATSAGEARGCAATVDGAAHRVARLAVGPRTTAAGGATVEELALEVDGRPHRALVARTRDRVLVAVAGRVWTFESGEEARGAHGAAGSGAVSAPMPGKVVSVLVAEGQVVEVGQALVVLEAMKMESTLAAEVAGRVTAVRATAGASVAAGDLLAKQWGDW